MEDEQEVIIWDGFRYYTGMTDKSYKMNLATGATFAITDDELIARKKNYRLFIQRNPFLAIENNGQWSLMTSSQYISTYGDMATQPPAYKSFQTENEASEFIAGLMVAQELLSKNSYLDFLGDQSRKSQYLEGWNAAHTKQSTKERSETWMLGYKDHLAGKRPPAYFRMFKHT